MISRQEAHSILREHLSVLPSVSISVDDGLHRILAEDVCTQTELPPFNSSAVDGYCLRSEDTIIASDDNPVSLAIDHTINAGTDHRHSPSRGRAVKVMTGALLPIDAETVVMREFTEEYDDHILIRKPIKRNKNIRYRGEEFHSGDVAMKAGTQLNPAGVALLASLGLKTVEVVEKPKVAIVTTGDEIVGIGESAQTGQIYNSNQAGLRVALGELGIADVKSIHVQDSLEDTELVFEQLVEHYDVILSAGGVSMGDRDYVKLAAKNTGFDICFDRVAIKPGKPFCFGLKRINGSANPVYWFGCPGNPVSALVVFHVFIKSALERLMGSEYEAPKLLQARLMDGVNKKAGRCEYVRGIYAGKNGVFKVRPARAQHSHMLSGLADANCLIEFPEAVTDLPSGTLVNIQPYGVRS